MTTTINADTVTGGAIVTADASGVLGLQAGGNTVLTLNSSRAVGVGASPSYGTSGQVLTSAGSAAAPTWTTPSASAMTFITSVTASNSATVDLENAMTAYDTYCVIASGIDPATANSMNLRLKISGAYVTTATYNSQYAYTSTTAFNANFDNNLTYARLIQSAIYGTNDNPANNAFFTLYINSPSSTTRTKPIFTTASFVNIGGATGSVLFSTCYNTGTGAVTGLRFYMNSGNIIAGTFRLYGISNS